MWFRSQVRILLIQICSFSSTYPYRRTGPDTDYSSEVHGYPLGAQKKRLSRGEEFILAPGDFSGRAFQSGSVGVELTTDGRALEVSRWLLQRPLTRGMS